MTNHTTRSVFFRDYRLLDIEQRAVQAAFENDARLTTRSKLVFALRGRPRLIIDLNVATCGTWVSVFSNTLSADQVLRMQEWIKWWLVEPVTAEDWWQLPELSDVESPADVAATPEEPS